MIRTHTVIRGGLVLEPGTGGAAPADIRIEAGVIREVGPPGLAAPEDAATIDAADRLVIPGLVNAHTHAHGGLGRGAVGDRVNLELFLNSAGAINGRRTLDDKYLSAALSAVEMVRKGCTACYDLFVEYPTPSTEGLQAVGQAYLDVGMRAVVAPMMADRTLYTALPGLLDAMPDRLRARLERIAAAPYEASVRAAEEAFRAWPFDRDLIRPAVAPTIPLHCSDDFLSACGRLMRDWGVGLHTHLAETKTQAVLGMRKYGRSLTAHLAGLGLLGPRTSVAHAIWIDRDDIGRLADAGATVAHNPMSNLRLGSGVAPVRLMRDLGLAVGVGTDASNTSDGQNMFEALRLTAYLSRLHGPDPGTWLEAADAFEMATLGSARALGMEGIGRIAPGLKADLVFLDLGHIHYVPLRAPLLQMAFAENGAAVQGVMVDGRMILEAGRLLTVDEASLRRRAEEAAARLDAANAESFALADSAAHIVGAFCIAHARADHPIHRRLPDLGEQDQMQ